jgi:Integrase core domain
MSRRAPPKHSITFTKAYAFRTSPQGEAQSGAAHCPLGGNTGPFRTLNPSCVSSPDPGKIERWHQTPKNRILLDNYYLTGDLERQIGAFVEHYNHVRYHESIDNLTPADIAHYGDQDLNLAPKRISVSWWCAPSAA